MAADYSKLSDAELDAIIGGGQAAPQFKKASTVGEDLSSLWNWATTPTDLGKSYVDSAIKHPGQALGGAAIGTVSALTDTLPFLANSAKAIRNYGLEKYYGYEIPQKLKDEDKVYYPGHEVASYLTNIFTGEPQTIEEQKARAVGSFADLRNLKNLPGVSKINNALPTFDSKLRAVENLQRNLGPDAEMAIKNKQAAEGLGLNLKPSEASGNPLVAAEEGTRGITNQGAHDLYAHQKKELPAQKQAISQLLDDVSASPEIVYDKVRDVSKSIIEKKKNELQAKAQPHYEKSHNVTLETKALRDPTIQNAIKSVLNDPIYAEELRGFQPNSIKVLDEAKKRIDDRIGAAERKGAPNRVRVLRASKQRLVNAMDEASPDYKKARSIYSEDLPAIKKLEDSAIGKIANMNDEQLKSVSNDIFSSGSYDRKKIGKYRDEISKEAPEIWSGLVRNHLEQKLSKGEVNGSSFSKNILQNENEYKNTLEALKGNKTAIDKLHLMKTTFPNLINGKTAKASAAVSQGVTEVPKGILGATSEAARRLLLGKYDKAAVTLMTGGKWDKELLALRNKTPEAKAIGLNDILGRIVAVESNEVDKQSEQSNNAPDYTKLSDEELDRIIGTQ